MEKPEVNCHIRCSGSYSDKSKGQIITDLPPPNYKSAFPIGTRRSENLNDASVNKKQEPQSRHRI